MGDDHRTFIKQSRAFIDVSRTLIGQTRRRFLRVMRRRSATLAPRLPSAAVPRVFAGPSSGKMRCTACGMTIPMGQPEYELVSDAQTLLLDRACFVAWENDRARN